jgi:A-factor type gamma-butyrolactone 1'-reductase (1S-forming)
MSGLLINKVALITGASSGIGAASAELFATEGATVVLAARRENLLAEVTEKINSAGGRASWVVTDVTSEDDTRRMVETVLSRHGRLDAAFNNAAVGPEHRPLADQSETISAQAVSVNLLGVWRCMRYEIRAMLETGGGAIVNNSSVAGVTGTMLGGLYSATKHGVIGLTKSGAADYGEHHIRVNALATGVTETPVVKQIVEKNPELLSACKAMSLLNRMATPAEIAQAAAWLCSDRSSFITGAVLAVDGGTTAAQLRRFPEISQDELPSHH